MSYMANKYCIVLYCIFKFPMFQHSITLLNDFFFFKKTYQYSLWPTRFKKKNLFLFFVFVMVPVDFLRRLFAGIRKPHPNMNSCSTKCLRLLQAKEMSLVKSRSWFSQPWMVTMCVYLLMDKRAQEKLSPWRETTEIMRQREWSHGPWNKCFGHPKTSEKKVGRWEMVRCFCLCDIS